MQERFSHEHFTDRARKVMQLANHEAQRFNHEYISTEHMLLGLIREGSGMAANVLQNLDVDLRKIRLEVEKLVESGPDMVITGKLPQTPRAQRAIEYSMEEARHLNHNYVGTEHLLLGLLREREAVAAQVLINLGLNLEDVRKEVLRLLGSGMRASMPLMPVSVSSGAPLDDLPADVDVVVAELDADIDRLNRSKEEAVADMDFERAAALRDEADKLRSRRRKVIRDWAANHPVDTSWLSGGESAVLRLARRISEHRCWDELPKLADALEQAGCTDAEMLRHCRRAAEHSSQCWVVNLLLAKAAGAD